MNQIHMTVYITPVWLSYFIKMPSHKGLRRSHQGPIPISASLFLQSFKDALPSSLVFHQWAFTGVSDGDNQVFLMPSISQSTRGCSLSYSYRLRLRSLCLKAKDASYAAQLFLPPQQPGWPHLLPCPIAPEARLRPVLSLLFSSQTQF